ncbi:MAG TPA: GNAT family N-acetyltransferase, partial [Cyclobacteriaceae bacterium]|nr:GNAT family N-acetyltransferase [Cyclobacteriaceae bacterium]
KSKALDILVQAFDSNPSVNHVVKQDNRREQRIRELMNYSFKVCSAFGEAWMSDDEQACALVLHPDKKRLTLNAIGWDLQLCLSCIGLNRVNIVLKRESTIKAFHPKEPISYLWFIGVNPSVHNKGIGSNLLKEVIHQSETVRRPIYLETSVESNAVWYQKYGFEIYQRLDMGYTLNMLRKI